jgi:hypothetical protein
VTGEAGDRDPWAPFRTEDDARYAPGVRNAYATGDVYPAGSQAWRTERDRRIRRILDDAFNLAAAALIEAATGNTGEAHSALAGAWAAAGTRGAPKTAIPVPPDKRERCC